MRPALSVLPEAVRQTVRTHVEEFLRNSERLRAMGVKARRGLILAGPPGTGKTLLGKVLADTLDASFLWVAPRHIGRAVSFDEIMTLARFVAPAVLFLEDLDLFGEERERNRGAGLGELMVQLDGAGENEDIVTIATTNRLEVIEKALRNRPGRFDRVVTFEAMDPHLRRKMLERKLQHAVLSDADVAYLVECTEDYTGAQIEELANTLYILALRGENDACPQRGRDGDLGCGQGQTTEADAVALDRQLIDAALGEVQVERKRKLGFHAA